MKISYNWLQQFLKIDWEATKIAELLTDLGLEVEGVEISYTAACPVRRHEDHTDRLAVFFSATNTGSADLDGLMTEINQVVIQRIGLKPDYLIPMHKDHIPKTAVGKIQRAELRKRFEKSDFDCAMDMAHKD